MLEAREKGLVRFLGVTGHTLKAPERHLASLESFDFDSVMISYNHSLLQKSRYATSLGELETACDERGIAFQTIKAVARRPWGDRPKTHNTYFYEPLVDQNAIDTAVHWVLGHPTAFLLSAGDLEILPKILDAAERFQSRPSDGEMIALAEAHDIEPIFK